MRHPYLDRAFPILLLCAAIGCGGDDKKSEPKGGDDDDDGSETGQQEPKPVTAIDFDKIDKSKKLASLTPGEVKGLCVHTREDLIGATLGECRANVVVASSGEECEENLKTCSDAIEPEQEEALKALCDYVTSYSEECDLTVSQYATCLKTLSDTFGKLECTDEPAPPSAPDCFEDYNICRWGGI